MVARAQIRVSLDTKKITGGRTTEESAGQSFSLAYFMMLILYISLLLYGVQVRSEEHTSELQSQSNLVCRLLLEKKKERIRILLDVPLGTQKIKDINADLAVAQTMLATTTARHR